MKLCPQFLGQECKLHFWINEVRKRQLSRQIARYFVRNPYCFCVEAKPKKQEINKIFSQPSQCVKNPNLSKSKRNLFPWRGHIFFISTEFDSWFKNVKTWILATQIELPDWGGSRIPKKAKGNNHPASKIMGFLVT